MTAPAGSRKDPAAELASRYLIEHLRAAASADPAFFDRAFETYRLVESMGGARADGAAPSDPTGHPLVAGALALMGARMRHVLDVATQASDDNRRVLQEFRTRLAARGLDAAAPGDRDEAEAEYERALAATVPIERSLQNVEAMAEGLELVNHVVNPSSFLARRVFEQAWKAVRSFVRDPALGQKVDELHGEIAGRPERLEALARSIREVGPGIVRGAYERGAAPPPRAAAKPPASKKAAGQPTGAKPKSVARVAAPKQPAKKGRAT